MDPILLTLLSYPLSILANFTYDKLIEISQRIDVIPLRDLFVRAFYQTLEIHDKVYDDYSRKVIEKLRKLVKKDENKLLIIFSNYSDNFNPLLSYVKRKEFQQLIATDIIREYSLELSNYPELMISIITDCLNKYLYAFFNQMNEREGIQTILIECLKINNVLDILKKIDSQAVTKTDFDELRRIVLDNYFKDNKEAKKELDDYDKYLKNKLKYIELRGFSPKISGKEVKMELTDIFVPLEINIDKSIGPELLGNSGVIEEEYSSTERHIDREVENKTINLLLDYRYSVILGDPGSGKSTLMKYIVISLIKSRSDESTISKIIPIFIRISDYSDFFKKTKKTFYEYITDYYDKQYQHIYKEGFECSNLLLLMDGLDETTDTSLRLRVTEQVMDLIARYPFNRYIVTSRIVGYQESKLGGDFSHFKLLPFGLDKIEQFAKQWYKSIAQHTDKDFTHAIEQSNSLCNSISRSPSVIRLATNPLLMTIIAMIHYKGQKLPNKRVELYDISTETFLEYWVQLRMDDESKLKDKNEIIEILAPIAFEIHQNKSNSLIEEKEFVEDFMLNFKNIHSNTSREDAQRECKEFINFLRQQAGFFYEKGIDDAGNRFFGFIHLTFEEYLSAIELISRWSEGKIEFKDFVFNPRWTEIIRLAAAQLRLSYKGRYGRTQSTQFIRDLLSVEDPFPEGYRPLQLICLILSDDVSINDDLLIEIINRIMEVISTTEFPDIIESFSKHI